jgi:hypothetical protein
MGSTCTSKQDLAHVDLRVMEGPQPFHVKRSAQHMATNSIHLHSASSMWPWVKDLYASILQQLLV